MLNNLIIVSNFVLHTLHVYITNSAIETWRNLNVGEWKRAAISKRYQIATDFFTENILANRISEAFRHPSLCF